MKNNEQNSFKKNKKHFVIGILLAIILSILLLKTVQAPTSGPNNPGTLADDSSYGRAVWSNPGNAQTSDNNYAEASISAKFHPSHYLKATNFGFSLSSATINGIVVEVEAKRDALSFNGIFDTVKLVLADGSVATTNKAAGTALTGIDTYYTFGGSTDTWGETLTDIDVNDVDFGVVVATDDTEFGPAIHSIDHIRITIYYTPSASQCWSYGTYGYYIPKGCTCYISGTAKVFNLSNAFCWEG